MNSCDKKTEQKNAAQNNKFTTEKEQSGIDSAQKIAVIIQAKNEWQNFKEDSESKMMELECDLTKFDSSFVKVNEIDFVYIHYKDAKENLLKLRNELDTEEQSFEKTVHQSCDDAVRNNEKFQEQFETEMTEVNESVKSLFAYNKSY